MAEGTDRRETITKLLKKKERLLHELLRVKTQALKAEGDRDSTDEPHHGATTTEDAARLENHQDQLIEASGYRDLKKLVLARVRCSQELQQMLFPPVAGPSGDQQPQGSQELKSLLTEQNALVQDICEELETIEQLHQVSVQKTQALTDLTSTNAALMVELQDAKQMQKTAVDTEEIKKLKDELASDRSMLEMQKCVLRHLVTGSGVDWSEDPDLFQLILKLDEPL